MACDLSQQTEENVTPALSPLYCCPEALTENTWSYASDLWSLGAILYHMFTGLLLASDNFPDLSSNVHILNPTLLFAH